jgi:uncharacterized protein (TIGR02271 family)
LSSQAQHLFGQHRDQHDSNVRREESGATIQLPEEELDVRTHAVDAGQISVGTQVVQEHRTIDVPVTREEVTVDRRPSEAPISEINDLLAVPAHEEQVAAEKQAVISEEVEVGKRAMHDRQNVSATVRKEVVDVDADGTCRWNLTPPSASNTRNPTPLS